MKEAKTKEQLVKEVARSRQPIAELRTLEAERKRAEATLELRAHQLETLNAIGVALTCQLDYRAVLQAIAEEVQRLMQAKFAIVAIPDEPCLRVEARAGDDDGYVKDLRISLDPTSPLGQGPAGRAFRSKTPVAVGDVLQDPSFAPWKEIASSRGIRSLVVVPLLYREECRGFLIVYSGVPRAFDQEKIQLLVTLASQAAIALENARLFQEMGLQNRSLSALNRVAQTVNRSLHLRDILEASLDAVLRAVEVEAGIIRLWDKRERALVATAHRGISAAYLARMQHLEVGAGVAGKTFQRGEPLIVEDIGQYPHLADVTQKEGVRSLASIPIRARERLVGVMSIFYHGQRGFSPPQVELLTTIGNQIGTAFENARLFEETLRGQERLHTLLEINKKIGATTRIDELLQTITDEAARLLQADAAGFRLLEGDDLVIRAVSGVARQLMLRPRLKLGESLSGRAAVENRPLFLHDATVPSPWLEEHKAAALREGVRSIMIVPVRVGDRVIGVMPIHTKASRHFTQWDVDLAMAFADQAAIAVEKTRLYTEVTDARDFLESIAANSADAIITTDVAGRITYFSPGAEEIFGYRAEQILDQPIADYYRTYPEDIQTVMQRLRTETQIRNYETAIRTKDGRWIDVNSSMSLLRDARGTVVGTLGITRDITERKRGEELLAGQREILEMVATGRTLQETLDALTTMIERLATGTLCSILLLDEAGQHLFHGSAPSLPKEYIRAVDGIAIGPCAGSCGTAAHGGETVIVEDTELDPLWADYRALARTYGLRACWSVPIRDGAGRVLGTFALYDRRPRRPSDQDVRLVETAAHLAGIAIERKRAEAALQGRAHELAAKTERLETLSRRLVEVQENERREIARELHDEIGQVVTGLKLTLETTTRSPTAAVGTSLNEAQALVNELMARVRELSLNLRPPMLDDLGLLPALLWHFDRYTAQTSVRVVLKQCGLQRRFTPELETAAYRIVQEALTNVARHAGVREVEVRLWVDRGTLSVQIEDQGKGFDSGTAQATGTSSGLAGMYERAVMLGGRLTVKSAPGAGTRVTAELPLAKHRKKGEER